MKKMSVMAVLALFFAFPAFAQLPVGAGLKAGLNFTGLPGASKSTTSTGFHIGAFGLVQPGKIGVRVEALISGKGAETELQYQDPASAIGSLSTLKGNVNLWYVDVPVLFDYKIVPGVHLHLGPQFSFLLSEDVSFDNLADASASLKNEQFSFKSSELSLAAGVGVTIAKIDAGVRYNLGLSKVSDFNIEGLKSTDLKNSVIQVYVGFKFL